MVEFVKEFLTTGVLPKGMNDTLLVLLAKVSNPEWMNNFRPISLCNVVYKALTKAMVHRPQPILMKVVGPTQRNFILGRLIEDKVVLVQEIIHSMMRKKAGKKWMLIKIDLEKAYDRLRWDFVEDTIRRLGIPDRWVNWITSCVSSPSMRIFLEW